MTPPPQSTAPPRDLDDVRLAIDRLDDAVVSLIGERLQLARLAGDFKRTSGRLARDTRREAEVIRRAAQRARELGVDDERVRDIFWRLIDLSHTTVDQDADRESDDG